MGAAQDGLDAGQHLVDGEGFGNIVVGAGGEAGEHVVLAALGGEEDDGDVAVEFAPHLFGHAEAGHTAHHDVEQDEGMVGCEQGEGFLGRGCRVDGIARCLEVALQNFPQVGLVVYYQNVRLCCHNLHLPQA